MRRTTISHAAITLAVVIGFGVAPQVAGPAATVTPQARLAAATVTQAGVAVAATRHVLVIMEENRGYQATLGNCGSGSPDPYLCSLAAGPTPATPKGATSYTNWFGILHNSIPDYIAIIAGKTTGCQSSACGSRVTDLGGQLSKASIPWAAYMEPMPSPCFTGSSSGQYTSVHNGFVHFRDDTPGTACHVLPYPGPGSIAGALTTGAPDYVWITPNNANDMHTGTIQAGDKWLKTNLGAVLLSSWFTNTAVPSTVIVTMDENNAQPTPAGGRVPMLVISNTTTGTGQVATYGNLYGTLRAIEETYSQTPLGAAANAANGDPLASF